MFKKVIMVYFKAQDMLLDKLSSS